VIIEFIPFVSSVLLVIIVLYMTFMKRKGLFVYYLIFHSLVIVNLAVSSFLCWFFRDGLGPDSVVETHGVEAWSIFFMEMKPLLIFVGIMTIIVNFVYRFRERGQKKKRDSVV